MIRAQSVLPQRTRNVHVIWEHDNKVFGRTFKFTDAWLYYEPENDEWIRISGTPQQHTPNPETAIYLISV